jgi:hypothetical protein
MPRVGRIPGCRRSVFDAVYVVRFDGAGGFDVREDGEG